MDDINLERTQTTSRARKDHLAMNVDTVAWPKLEDFTCLEHVLASGVLVSTEERLILCFRSEEIAVGVSTFAVRVLAGTESKSKITSG